MKRSHKTFVLIFTSLLLLGGLSVLAQAGSQFRTRLSPLAITNATAGTMTGQGFVTATLAENNLSVEGTFEGVSSPATAAHIHHSSIAGVPGPVAFPLEVSQGTSGTVSGSAELSAEEIEELRNGHYYVQIHTENNPGGEIRGWLWPTD